VTCSACGAANEPGERFCGECGSPLEGAATESTAVAGPSVERRFVSVLFADLVGFAPLSESRDAEEVRELLSRYFDTARTVIGRYGGNVEKFIGDAVMAVWGAPTTQEDDAERAVRAGLELVDAVAALGEGLAARAGVLTGEAAVTIGAEGQGMRGPLGQAPGDALAGANLPLSRSHARRDDGLKAQGRRATTRTGSGSPKLPPPQRAVIR
jgi:hypothetical protein